MKLRVLALVSAILVVLAVAAFAVNRWMTAPKTEGRVGKILMSDVDLAKATRIEIVSPDHTVTLHTEHGREWSVAQEQDFPVDPKKLKTLFVRLTSEKIAHKVTDNADKLPDLGLLTADENNGKLEASKTARVLSVLGKDDKPIFGLLMGNDRRGQGAMTFGGVYVRYPKEKAAYLIGDSVVTDYRPEDWIDTSVLDLNADKDIRSVRVEQPGQRPVHLSRAKADDPFKLDGMPDADLDKSQVRRVTGQLAGLSAFKVKAGDTPVAEVGRARTGRVELELFDKRHFTVDVGEAKAKDDYRYITVRATLDASVKDPALHEQVDAFNKRFVGRLLGVYDFDGKTMLTAWKDYKVKPKKKS